MNLIKLLLYPFAAIYNGVMRVRNHLYDIGQKPSFHFETSVIAVGNLNVGGSGKTPMVEYLIQLLSKDYPTVTLSRGYKRETSGYRVATAEDTANSIGDEPMQLFQKFGESIHVAVGEDRVFAIPHILQDFPETEVLLLDDAMQQRSIKPNLTILLSTCEHPFFRDYLLPFGRLRESRRGASRADVVVITKCDAALGADEQTSMTARVLQYAGAKPVFFSCIEYGSPQSLLADTAFSSNVIVVTGIADAAPLLAYCAKRFQVLRHFRFADHHRYTLADLQEIEGFCTAQTGDFAILTTEKDIVKLKVNEFSIYLDKWKWFSLPIKHMFLKDGAKFDELVHKAVKRTPTN